MLYQSAYAVERYAIRYGRSNGVYYVIDTRTNAVVVGPSGDLRRLQSERDKLNAV